MLESKFKKFNIQCIAEDMVEYIIEILNGNKADNIACAPKKFRGDYIPMLRNKAEEILSFIVLANNLDLNGEDSNEDTRAQRLHYQQLALANCAVLDVRLKSACKVGCISAHQFETATGHTYNLSTSIRNWIISDRKRLQEENLVVESK